MEHAIDENEIITRMRQTNEAFTQMMKKVNSIIKFVVTGENDEEEHGCSGPARAAAAAATSTDAAARLPLKAAAPLDVRKEPVSWQRPPPPPP